MSNESQLVAAADENFLASFRKLVEHSPGGEVQTIGGVFAFVTGLPVSFFNGCVVVEPASATELAVALAWVGRRNVPHRAWIGERFLSSLRDVPAACGLDSDPAPLPGMVLHPPPETPAPSDELEIDADGANVDAFLRVAAEAGVPRELAARLFPASFASDPDVQLFVGRLAGRPVGTSIAIRSREASGVYNVTTLPDARRQGVGTALTWAAVASGVAWGSDTIVLQSTEMGLSLYTAMGFHTVSPYAMFGPATG